MSLAEKPVGIFYEHPEWFKPLFRELKKRGIVYKEINAANHQYDAAEQESEFSLVINRMSSSSYLRGNVQGLFHTTNFLYHLEKIGVPVINGAAAQFIETSKAKQISLLASLGLDSPKSRVINHVDQIIPAAKSLQFPLVVKVNIGGSGAGIVRFDTLTGLQKAIDEGQINLGVDHTALVQEFIPAKGGHIIRVETLNGKFLYAMKVYTTGETFNLCPAEICQVPDPNDAQACLIDGGKKGLKIEAYTPPADIIAAVERIAKAACLDVGGIEYLISEKDNKPYFYDINALSNFVADAPTIIGFDPYINFVDYIEYRMKKNLTFKSVI